MTSFSVSLLVSITFGSISIGYYGCRLQRKLQDGGISSHVTSSSQLASFNHRKQFEVYYIPSSFLLYIKNEKNTKTTSWKYNYHHIFIAFLCFLFIIWFNFVSLRIECHRRYALELTREGSSPTPHPFSTCLAYL